jgi:PTH1 family peptidyl-tRNA hydrolase
VLGLGNPGQRYEGTRHNLGFRVLELLARRHALRWRSPGGSASIMDVVSFPGGQGPLILAKPRTFMNDSGRAAALLCRRHQAAPGELLVVHDDADLALGRVRIRSGGGAGGHNGVQSVIEELDSADFYRLKLGVEGEGRRQDELAEYVLAPFETHELAVVEALIELAVEALESIASEGLGRTMNRYSGRSVAATGPGGTDP